MFWNWLSWLRSFLEYTGLKSKSGKLVFIGLDNAGKTTLLSRLKYGSLTACTAPTPYHTSESMSVGGFVFTAFDLGGHAQARRVWRDFYPAVDAIVYIIDTSDVSRLDETKSELLKVIEDDVIADCPILILGNKIDKPGALSETDMRNRLQIDEFCTGKETADISRKSRPLELFMCSVVRNQGFGEGFRWLAKYLK